MHFFSDSRSTHKESADGRNVEERILKAILLGKRNMAGRVDQKKDMV